VDYTSDELANAFFLIQDDENWKEPIVSLINKADFELMEAATVHYTGSLLDWEHTDDPNLIVISAAGYYATIGA